MKSNNIPKLEIGTLLGQGKFAKVYKSSWQGQDVAVKAYQRKLLTTSKKKDIDCESHALSEI